MLVLASLLVLAGQAFAAVQLNCPEGFYLFGEKCYSIGRGTSSFDGASRNCKPNAEFATVETAEENEFLKGLLRTVDSEGVVGAYFGAAYDSSKGWGSFSDFTTDPAPSGEGLCPMFTKANDWAWTAVDCAASADTFYICEMDYVLRECFEGGHCYSVSPDYSCQADIDELAIILSEEEDQQATTFLKEALDKGKEVGLLSKRDTKSLIKFNGRDEDEEGTWKVVDSDVIIDYKNWAPGQPDNDPTSSSLGSEDCLGYDPGQNFQWVDIPCSGMYLYFCESTEPLTVG